MKVIVIGGGASGMTAAITSRRCGNDVTIIEKNNNLGKKLLLTGNGRCNYFNENMDISNFFSNGDVTKIINDKNINKVKSFFYSMGFISKIKDGYYYPYSNTSTSIQNYLAKEIEVLKIKVINEEVIDILKEDKFIIKTNNNSYECDKLILSTGGITYPKTGSNGFGYNVLKKFGHKIIPVKPALVPLVTNEDVKLWKGIRVNVHTKLYVDDILVSEDSGEAQLTDYGISGICIMNLSRFVDKNKKNTLVINFLPVIDNDLKEFLDERNKKLKNRSVIELLEMLINYKLLYYIFNKLKLDTRITWNELNSKEKDLLIEYITNYKLNIVDTKDENYGEVTCGGVSLDEINCNCESTIVPNLYITGELLDIDGYCGGYNLTVAWISGILSGEDND